MSYSNYLDTGPYLVDSPARVKMGFVGRVAGRIKLVLTLLSCKISSNIYNYNSCFIIPYTNCLLEFEKDEGRIAITDLTTQINGWMEAETPRPRIRRPACRQPDDDGVTELDAGAEIDVESGVGHGGQRGGGGQRSGGG